MLYTRIASTDRVAVASPLAHVVEFRVFSAVVFTVGFFTGNHRPKATLSCLDTLFGGRYVASEHSVLEAVLFLALAQRIRWQHIVAII